MHGVSEADANDLELSAREEPEKDSASEGGRGPPTICTHPFGAGNHPRRGMMGRLTRMQKEKNTNCLSNGRLEKKSLEPKWLESKC